MIVENNKSVVNTSNKSSDKSKKVIKEIKEWAKAILIAVIVALIIRGFLFEPVEVQGHSMNDTLQDGQRLILYKLGYYFYEPKRGDIIVLQVDDGILSDIPVINKLPFVKKMYPFPQEIDYIKRVIAVPGDEIDLRDGYVYVNGEKLDEPYAKGKTYEKELKFPLVVPENKVFVLGDNREYSSDSRYIGFIDFENIKGKVIYRYWPLKDFGGIY